MNIAVDDRRWLVEGNAGDRAGSIGADPGQLAQLRDGDWNGATMPLADQACRSVQIAGATIVAETLPRLEHVVEPRFRESRQIGEPFQPAVVIRSDGVDPGLLQHD